MGHVKPVIGKAVDGEIDGKAMKLAPVTIYVDYESAVNVAKSRNPATESDFQHAYRREVLACVSQCASHFANKQTQEETQAQLEKLQAQAEEGHAEVDDDASSDLNGAFKAHQAEVAAHKAKLDKNKPK